VFQEEVLSVRENRQNHSFHRIKISGKDFKTTITFALVDVCFSTRYHYYMILGSQENETSEISGKIEWA